MSTFTRNPNRLVLLPRSKLLLPPPLLLLLPDELLAAPAPPTFALAAAAASASIAETCPGLAGCSRAGDGAGLVGAFNRGASAQLRRLLRTLDVVWYRCMPGDCIPRADLSS
jgi:hypothetical protein